MKGTSRDDIFLFNVRDENNTLFLQRYSSVVPVKSVRGAIFKLGEIFYQLNLRRLEFASKLFRAEFFSK